MNRINNWKQLLGHANEELKPKGFSIRVTDDGEGFFDCKIYKGRKLLETYAENFFEAELPDLVNEVWGYTLRLAS